MGNYLNKSQVEIVATTPAQQLEIDKALLLLAQQGIYVNVITERDTRTGKSFEPIHLIDTYYRNRKGA